MKEYGIIFIETAQKKSISEYLIPKLQIYDLIHLAYWHTQTHPYTRVGVCVLGCITELSCLRIKSEGDETMWKIY